MEDQIYVDVVLCDRKGRFLLQHHPRSQMKPWRFPGGKPEPGETLIGAAAREAKEELGIEPLSLVYIGKKESVVESGTWTGYMFLCDRYIGRPRIVEKTKHDMLEWIPIENIVSEPERTFALQVLGGQVDGF
jgi:8-oxo-dGTP pyrophosphatase MutT (NUDIX family)